MTDHRSKSEPAQDIGSLRATVGHIPPARTGAKARRSVEKAREAMAKVKHAIEPAAPYPAND